VKIETLKLGAGFLLLQLAVGVAYADPLLEDSDWLKTMAFAGHQTNYCGVFVYQSGGRVEMSRITHISDKTGEHERLEGLDGLKREVIRNNDKVWLYLGDKKVRIQKRRIQRTFPSLLPDQIQTLKENYHISQGEEDRVADYHAHTVIFQPKDGLRYTRKMWAHSGSGLLLKAVVLDEHGSVIEEYAFSQLEIGGKNIDRKWIVPNETEVANLAGQKNLSPLPKASIENTPSGWQVDFVPAGFKKILEMRRVIADKKLPVVHIVYSDGLSGISVFIEKVGEVTDIPGLSGRGAVHMYNRLVGDNLVTVVGEVPPRVVIQVADSVRYAGE
jgi:sigma-E factor negative regulatory protein RseB